MADTAYITTPIYYPSGKPHLGSAYTSTAADVYARYMRLQGRDTFFLTGTDEHGLKLQRAAEKQDKTPQAYVDEMSAQFRTLSEIMNLSNDDFIRTTEPRHHRAAQHMWQKLMDAGLIYKAGYSGWYCVSDEAYYDEKELKTDAAGQKVSPMSGHPVEWMEEESYFFKLSAFTDELIDLYTRRPELVQPQSRCNEVLGFVKQGLTDISISRTTFNWGVPVPGDSAHVMYVWIDALTNYLSALDWPQGDKMRYWPQAVHLVGKDILRFHAVYWPAMLLGAGMSENDLPRIYAHGWWTVDGDKMSKSKGNVVDPQDVCARFGRDAVRYFMLREMPFGNDGDFSEARLIERINTELANQLGNLFQRTLSMVQKNCAGKVPALDTQTAEDKNLINTCEQALDAYAQALEQLHFDKAIAALWRIVREANQYMDNQKPWELKNTDPVRMAHVLRVLVESFGFIALMSEPFMPEAAQKMQAQLDFEPEGFVVLTSFPLFKEVQELPAPQAIFPRHDIKEAAA